MRVRVEEGRRSFVEGLFDYLFLRGERVGKGRRGEELSLVWYGVVRCGTVWYGMVLYGR